MTESHRRCWPSLVGWGAVGGLLAYILVIHSTLRMYEEALATQQHQLDQALKLVGPLAEQTAALRMLVEDTARRLITVEQHTESDWSVLWRYMELASPESLSAVDRELTNAVFLKEMRTQVASFQRQLTEAAKERTTKAVEGKAEADSRASEPSSTHSISTPPTPRPIQ